MIAAKPHATHTSLKGQACHSQTVSIQCYERPNAGLPAIPCETKTRRKEPAERKPAGLLLMRLSRFTLLFGPCCVPVPNTACSTCRSASCRRIPQGAARSQRRTARNNTCEIACNTLSMLIELRPNDLASRRSMRRTDDLPQNSS
jgi:hypothetical protein